MVETETHIALVVREIELRPLESCGDVVPFEVTVRGAKTPIRLHGSPVAPITFVLPVCWPRSICS